MKAAQEEVEKDFQGSRDVVPYFTCCRFLHQAKVEQIWQNQQNV